MSQFSAIAGSSSCRMSPASTIALYSSRIASCACEQKLLVSLVVPVRDARRASRRDRGHEAFVDAGGLQRGLEARDVGLDRGVARIRELADANRPQRGPGPGRDSRIRIA
jgi:hypothetical protein